MVEPANGAANNHDPRIRPEPARRAARRLGAPSLISEDVSRGAQLKGVSPPPDGVADRRVRRLERLGKPTVGPKIGTADSAVRRAAAFGRHVLDTVLVFLLPLLRPERRRGPGRGGAPENQPVKQLNRPAPQPCPCPGARLCEPPPARPVEAAAGHRPALR